MGGGGGGTTKNNTGGLDHAGILNHAGSWEAQRLLWI